MKDRTEREIDEIVRNGTSITEMIIEDHNSLNPIIATPEMKERGIENFDKIIKTKMAKKYASKINQFLTKYPNYRDALLNHENLKNLFILYPQIKNQLN